MNNEKTFEKLRVTATVGNPLAKIVLHRAWIAFIHYCTELQHGEIEVLRIHDGLPVLAESVRKKVKFVR